MPSSSLKNLSRARIPHAEEYYDRLEYEADPLGGFRLRPNQRLPHVTVNGDGYRGRPFSGEETILLLGDSVTFGVGASSDEARLACFLESFTRQPVADASVRAYRLLQHYGQLPVLLGRLPCLKSVFLWCGYVDLSYWVVSGGSIEGTFQFAQKYAPASFHEKILGRLRGKRSSACSAQRGSLEALVLHMTVYLAAIRDLLAARQVEITVLVQPFVRSQPKEPTARLLNDSYDEKTHEKVGIGWYELSGRFFDFFQSRLREIGIRWIDCQAFVLESDFLDQVHLKESAIRKIAEQLAQELVVMNR